MSTNLGAHEFVSSDRLHERDGVGIELVGLVGLVDDGERNSEVEPLEITNLNTTHRREREGVREREGERGTL